MAYNGNSGEHDDYFDSSNLHPPSHPFPSSASSVSPYHDESPSQPPAASGYGHNGYEEAPTPPLHAHGMTAESRGNPFSDAHAQESPHNIGYAASTHSRQSATPGIDNFGATAVGGGIAGLAADVASALPRSSGLQAVRGLPAGSRRSSGWGSQQSLRGNDVPMDHYPAQPVYSDSPYKRYSSPWDPRVDQNEFDPNDIEDDGDDGLGAPTRAPRKSMLGGAAGAAAGGAAGYGQVPGGQPAFEKKDLLAAEAAKRRKKRVVFIILGVLALLLIIAAAVIAGILGSRNSNSASSSSDVDEGTLTKNSPQIQELLGNSALKMVFPGMDYTPFNAQYPACLTNPPSQNNVTMDMAVLSQLTKTVRLYGTDCNQTDMVVEAFRLLEITDMKVWLGVWLDNNQTTNARGLDAMYDILERNGQEPFAGVIVGNEVLFRQDMTPQQLASVVASVKSNFTEKKISLPIGVADLGDNWQKDGSYLINDVDAVMSNIHPFFAGQTASEGSGWAWTFWQGNDAALTQGTSKMNIISEIGWPSAGGNDCGVDSAGDDVKCPNSTAGAVAGVTEMNTFMEDFVCTSLTNKTNYFWFEAFDEPWKAIFNTPGEDWEDKWGLMTSDRQVKPGLNIPDCNGQTIT